MYNIIYDFYIIIDNFSFTQISMIKINLFARVGIINIIFTLAYVQKTKVTKSELLVNTAYFLGASEIQCIKKKHTRKRENK